MKTNQLKKIIKAARAHNVDGGNDCLLNLDGTFYPIKSVQFIIDEQTKKTHITFCSEEAPAIKPSESKPPFFTGLKIKFKIKTMVWTAKLLRLFMDASGGTKKD